MRSTASIALHVLRLVEDALIRDASHDIVLRSRTEVALYVLNQKRLKLIELEQRFGVSITVMSDVTLTGMVYHAIERGEPATPALAPAPRRDLVRVDSIAPIFEPEDDVGSAEAAEGDTEFEAEPEGAQRSASDDAEGGRRRKRRRRRRGRDISGDVSADGPQPSDDGMATMAEIGGDMQAEITEAEPVAHDALSSVGILPFGAEATEVPSVAPAVSNLDPEEEPAALADEAVEQAPRRRRSRRTAVAEKDEVAPEAELPVSQEAGTVRRRRRPSRARTVEAASEAAPSPAAPSPVEETMARPSADRDVGADTVEHHAPSTAPEVSKPAEDVPSAPVERLAVANDSVAPPAAEATAEPAPDPDPDRPKRSGWWQRAKASFGS